MAQEGDELGGMRGRLRGLNKTNYVVYTRVAKWLYKYVKYGWLVESGMIIIMPYFAFMDDA